MKPHFLLLVLLALPACATRPKTYKAPSSTKIIASSQRVSATVTKAQTTAAKARQVVKDAKSTAEDVTTISGVIDQHVKEIPNVPQGLLNEITRLQVVESVLTSQLAEGVAVHDTLFRELGDAQDARVQLQKDQVDYMAQSQVLANNATAERDARISAEKSLSWYRWHSWLMKLGAAAIGLVAIGVLFLWLTGRLAGLAAKFV